ncbi:ABC transporter ATP-binding protein [Agrilutibacter solisilvae]|uniref:ATP-binding cassette domain-containing protein n=1 Tax=Agrilutibacter solisilvae TaxID=2763317 RepID=A0A975AU64_9GAMM|nr:ATP-binding cassette domain-containing protein [Lysobacter solisilvae]QSX79870.1 ATP-binding cassette domain-containing protein [Lysobacter solisilvae]
MSTPASAATSATGSAATAPAAVSLELREIVQEYPTADGKGVTRVVDSLSLRYDRPGINMLLGPSGCGKSTVLRMMGGVRPIGVATPTSGTVLIDGAPCVGAHDDSVMVFQRYANRPDLSVWDNVAFPFRLGLWRKRVAKAQWSARVDDILKAVGLWEHRALRPAQLSGGQNQRVALARALVLEPRILLMDEPFAALDAQTRVEMQQLLNDLYVRRPCLIVFVTHDVIEALALGDRVTVLSTQPARIADEFTIDEPRPRSATWQRATDTVKLEERVLNQLHAKSAGRGTVAVSI